MVIDPDPEKNYDKLRNKEKETRTWTQTLQVIADKPAQDLCDL